MTALNRNKEDGKNSASPDRDGAEKTEKKTTGRKRWKAALHPGAWLWSHLKQYKQA